uniref:Olfactory receptor n=1 Tax=Sphenodon punctatus TaxID=8508 RepID=A0A8D0L5E1_SPHPU
MERDNSTPVAEFVLLGLPNQTIAHTILFAMIVLIFIASLSGNSLLLFLIYVNSTLHTPMYFFLCQLSFMDICQITAVVPKILVSFVTRKNVISLAGCGAQIFFTLTMGGAECLLLAVMSYDRYVAICSPLQYSAIMSRRLCLTMSAGVWLGAFLDAFLQTVSVMYLPFCRSNVVNHLFCEVPVLMKLSCSDISVYETVLFVLGILLLLIPSSVILASYIRILSAILRMCSAEGRRKAFSTCSSHLTVVGLFYGAAIFMYMRPSSYHSPEQDRIVSVFYTIVAPIVNPLIYSLRNRDVLAALRKLGASRRPGTSYGYGGP